MKTKVIFGMLSLMVIATAANAADLNNDRRMKLFKFSFACEFHDMNDVAALQPAPRGEALHCDAFAQVFAWVDTDDWMTNMLAMHDVANKLVVRCGDDIVYADGAFLNPGKRFVSIKGINGTPAIFVERHDHERISKGENPYDAFLFLTRDKLRGTCNVHNEPVERIAE